MIIKIEIEIAITQQNQKNLNAQYIGGFSTISNNARHGDDTATFIALITFAACRRRVHY